MDRRGGREGDVALMGWVGKRRNLSVWFGRWVVQRVSLLEWFCRMQVCVWNMELLDQSFRLHLRGEKK
jgi:hypothetical protein